MQTFSVLTRVVGAGFVALALGGCAADELDSDDWDESFETSEIAVSGRWIPSASVTALSDRQYARYDDAPPWAGGRYCGGRFLSGTRQLGDYIRANFRGVSSYGGYVCRQNTANAAQTSMHGTGRAIDVMVPTRAGGAADNTVGDAIAAWLITNASELGVQLVIWDRSSWNASRAAGQKLRGYGGPHPHNDHLHVELNSDGATARTSWYSNHSVAPLPGASPTPTPAPTPTPSPSPSPTPTPAPAATYMRVNVSALNLRRGPSTSDAVLSSMACGSRVTFVSGPSSGWYQVDYNGTRGWASGNYLLPEASFSMSVCGR